MLEVLPVVITIFEVWLWLGIMPGVGSIGKVETIKEWVHHHSHSGHCAEDYKIVTNYG